MRALEESLYRALLTRATWTLESFLSAQAIVWGAWVGWPWTDVFRSIPGDAYSVMALVPEGALGLVFLIHGLVHGWAIRRKDVHLCRRAALAAAVLWSIVFASLLATIPLATSTPIYASNVGACLWVYLRLHLRFANPPRGAHG